MKTSPVVICVLTFRKSRPLLLQYNSLVEIELLQLRLQGLNDVCALFQNVTCSNYLVVCACSMHKFHSLADISPV